MTSHQEIQKEIAELEEEVVVNRVWKDLGILIPCRNKWQDLARDISIHFKLDKKEERKIFGICNPENAHKIRKTTGEIERIFHKSKGHVNEAGKDYSYAYFWSCFRKNK